MDNFGKVLIALGALLLVIGLFWHFGGRYLPFGRLPGDIAIDRGNFKFYFPLATSLLLSALLTLLVWLFQRFFGR